MSIFGASATGAAAGGQSIVAPQPQPRGKGGFKGSTAAGIASLLLQTMGGISALQAQNREADAFLDQAFLLEQTARANQEKELRTLQKFKAKQAAKFLKSGVLLSGTPLTVLDETETEGLREIESNFNRQARLANLSRRRAGNARSIGRSALFQGFGGALIQGLTLTSGAARSGVGNITGANRNFSRNP